MKQRKKCSEKKTYNKMMGFNPNLSLVSWNMNGVSKAVK